MTAAHPASVLSLVAHIRRLSSAGSVLYVRIDSSDISRLGLKHGQAIEIDLGRSRVAGVVKTSGGSPWLAPPAGGSNATITTTLREAHLAHGMDVPATARLLDIESEQGSAIGFVPVRAVARMPVSLHDGEPLRIDSTDAVLGIRQYNAGFYRGRSNTALDREAYRRFRNGLSSDLSQLVEQIAFVGQQYGGAQERFGDIRKEAELIAANLSSMLDQWLKVVVDAKPLADERPSEAVLDYLFSPFRGTKQWPVWASKTLHFLRPEVFPILDSNAKKPLGLRNLVNSSRGYHQFSGCFREALLSNTEALAAARIADDRESPTDLKVLDKILFQLGIRMK